jgi:hypothetical protein
MGKPAWGHARAAWHEHIVSGEEPGELKHLSTSRKREDSVSSGERTRISPNPLSAGVVGRASRDSKRVVERHWDGRSQRVIIP